MTTSDSAAPPDDSVEPGHSERRWHRHAERLTSEYSLRWAMFVGVIVRLVWIPTGSGIARFTNTDSSSYSEFAARLPGIMSSTQPGDLSISIQRTPGYPLFLWAASVGSNDRLLLAVVVQCLVGGAMTVWLIHRLAQWWFGPLVAGVAAWLLALDPVSISHSLFLSTETVTAAAWLAALLATLYLIDARDGPAGPRWCWATAMGLATGAAALTRPAMLGWILLSVVSVALAGPARRARWFDRRLVPSMALAVLVAASMSGAWMARNHHVTGSWIYSSVTGHNLFDLAASGRSVENGNGSWFDADSTLDAAGISLMESAGPPPRDLNLSDPVDQDRWWRAVGWPALRHHPAGVAAVGAGGLVRTLAGPGHSLFSDYLGQPSAPIRIVLMLWSGVSLAVLLAASVWGSAQLWRRGLRLALAWWALPLTYYLLTSAGPWGYARFRVPVAPMLCVLAAVGLAALIEARSKPQADSAGIDLQ